MIFVRLTGPSSGNGEDGSRTVSAQLNGVDGEPQVESSETRERRTSLAGGDDM